jgi:amino acid transporter
MGTDQRPPAGERSRSSQPLAPDLELREIRKGSRPGSRYVRLVPKSERPFERLSGAYRATEVAIRPRSAVGRVWRSSKRVLVGAPLATSELEEQKIPKIKALAVFSSDALSSSAYATDEILLVLIAAGAGALTHSIEIALAIGLLLAIVTFSYRQTIRAYPNGGGAYIVARENLGDVPGLTAAAALSVDYVLTVAVSLAAGVFAITSAFPGLQPYSVEIAVSFLGLVTLANLRGIRDSSTVFAIPTYAFIVSFIVLIVFGFIRIALDPGLRAPVPSSAVTEGTAGLSAYLLLRAFASGSAALTGVEAISNGIPAFKKPESRNAAATLLWMVVLLTFFFIGLTILAHQLHVRHADAISVPAQVAKTLFGTGVVFYFIQASTALILILAANTSYADFPRLSSILAKDKFLPHQFSFRGDRLGFSNGILVLAAASALLLVAFKANVDKLIPLYAFGVFVSFTLSQSGMVVHWLRTRESGWRRSIAVNAVGAVATGVVALIIGGTKFIDGAWISMLLMVLLGLMFAGVRRHYDRVGTQLELPPEAPPASPATAGRTRRVVVVPVKDLSAPVLRTLEYTRTLSDYVVAVHVAFDDHDHAELVRSWEAAAPDVPLTVVESPNGSFVAPMLWYLDVVRREDPEAEIMVAIPQLIVSRFWERPLHNQTAARLKRALSGRPRTIMVEVPYQLS